MNVDTKVNVAILAYALGCALLGIVDRRLTRRQAMIMSVMLSLIWSFLLIRWAVGGPMWLVLLLFALTLIMEAKVKRASLRAMETPEIVD